MKFTFALLCSEKLSFGHEYFCNQLLRTELLEWHEVTFIFNTCVNTDFWNAVSKSGICSLTFNIFLLLLFYCSHKSAWVFKKSGPNWDWSRSSGQSHPKTETILCSRPKCNVAHRWKSQIDTVFFSSNLFLHTWIDFATFLCQISY